ncbi:MAG: iron-sulfur cluster-binding domain protein [Deltaproteobacteria bacterium]|nr:iron-sulfur cluster-binding domain protein [Deltaproteobacteria bacterium]
MSPSSPTESSGSSKGGLRNNVMKTPVSIVRCETYDDTEVLNGLRRSIDLIGGIGAMVKQGDRVLLKPNLLLGKPQEKAVTTHPSIVKGMIQIVREAGGIPSIGDSPGMGTCFKNAEKAGIKRVAEEMNCPVVELDRPVLPEKRQGKYFKHIEIDRTALEADVVINLPKWKTHGMMLLTLGVKNMFGCISGPRKALWHLKAGEDRILFARMLADVYRIVQPSLTVLDGVVGMDGNGPGSGHPIGLGLIMASRDAFSLDQIVCDLLKIRRKSLPTNQVAFEEGIMGDGPEVVGVPVDQVRIPKFELPPLYGLTWGLPFFVRVGLKSALTSKPSLNEAMCVRCERCVEICPPKALTGDGEALVFDDKKCIRCFCCQEVCPEGAISLRPGWVLRIAGRKR